MTRHAADGVGIVETLVDDGGPLLAGAQFVVESPTSTLFVLLIVNESARNPGVWL